MEKGLSVWQNDNKNVLLDADNVFWSIVNPAPRSKERGFTGDGVNNKDGGELNIPREVISLYEKVKDNLDKEMKDFRFSRELSAIYIDPTDKCNARCSYCYIPAKIRRNGRSMTGEELAYILEKIKKYFSGRKRKPVIVFHASEPLLVKEVIFEAIKKYSRHFKFGLQTNAILIEKADVKLLKKYRVGVGISLDSSFPAINDRLRVGRQTGGNFDKAVKAIEWFDGYEGLNIITTVTKRNVNGLSRLVSFLHAKKVPCVLLNPVRLTQKNSRILKPNEKVLSRHFIEAVKNAVELSQNSKHKIIIGNFTNVILAIVSPAARRLMCDISPCGGGRCFFTITADGTMIPCGEFIGLKDFSGGNIFEDSIRDAMESTAFTRIRSRFVENIPECNVCVLRNICGAPCPAELHSLGNMHEKAVFCEFYKEIIKYALKILSEGKEKYCFRGDGLSKLEYAYCL